MWEYKTVKINTKGVVKAKYDELEVDALLNEYGAQNWELVNFVIDYVALSGITAIFKREVK